MIVDLRMRKRYMWLKMNDMEVMSDMKIKITTCPIAFDGLESVLLEPD